MSIKIVQISACSNEQDESLYGLSEDGKVYYWGNGEIKEEIKDETGRVIKTTRKYGWKEQIDEINN